MPKVNLSVCILALNEEKKIKKCLDSVKDWVREIVVVVDRQSSDKTHEIVKKYTDKVWVEKHKQLFHKNKQVAIERASSKWILWLDADEVVTEELKKEIIEVIRKPKHVGYKLKRQNIIFDKWIEHTGWYPDWQVRMFKNGKAKFPCKSVHEDIKVQGEIGELENNLVHYNYESVEQFIDKLNKYTSIDAKRLVKQFENKALVKPLIVRPIDEFIKRYLSLEGYRDGFHGLALSLMQAFYEMIVVVKVWELNKFDDQEVESIEVVEGVFKKLIHDWRWWKKEVLIRKANKLKRVSLKAFRKLGF